MPIEVAESTEIPLDDFVNAIHQALGADIPPDLADLFMQLRHASGPDIPGLIARILLYVPTPDGYDDAPVFTDYERY